MNASSGARPQQTEGRWVCAIWIVLAICWPGFALANDGGAVEYRVSLQNRDHHEARLEVTFPDAPDPLEVRMSRSSPGRYALHDFAKNVYSVSARDAEGRALDISRPDPHGWEVSGQGGGRAVIFSYTLYGDLVDGTYAGIDESHAHLNAPAAFVWARELAGRPARVSFPDLPAGWRVSSQLQPVDETGRVFAARDLAYLLDSPIEASDHEVHEWQVAGPVVEPQRPQTMRLAIHHQGSAEEARAFVELAKAVTAEEIAIFGETPRFDHGSYTFLADYVPWADGDGMEHRNSTVLTSARPLAEGAVDNLGTVAHELVHAWSIERIRPRSLEPFDFERENPSGELWFGEGFTSYYDDLVLRRTRTISLDRFAERLGSMVRAITDTAARAFGGPVAMSERAAFVDAASWVDPTNDANTFLSYYTYGAALGLALDLELRARRHSLDELMAAMWRRFGRDETPYTNEDLRAVLAEVTEDPAWADQWFGRYVFGAELPDYPRLLASVGLAVRPMHEGRTWLGDVLLEFDDEDGALVVAPTRIGSPLYDAGVDRGDVVLELDGERPESFEHWREVLSRHQPGDTVRLLVRGRAATAEVSVTLRADPALEVVSFEAAGRALDEATRQRRESWLAPRAQPPALHRYCPEDGAAFPFEYEHCPTHGNPLSLVREPGRPKS